MAARTIALMNQKGGVGKTTTTVNLAAGLAELNRRVLIVDLDPQAHASLHLGIDDGSRADSQVGSVYDLLLDSEAEPASLAPEIKPNLSVIRAETDLAAAETELAELADRHHRLGKQLQRLSEQFDFILIDCPPSLGLLTINALVAADEVIVPMQAQFLALQGVGKLLETVRLIAEKVNTDLRVAGLVLCMFEGQTTHAQEVVSDLERFLESQRQLAVPWRDARVYRPAIRRNVKLAECPSFGQTIFEYAPWAPGAIDYRKVAEQVAAEQHRAGSPHTPSTVPTVVVPRASSADTAP